RLTEGGAAGAGALAGREAPAWPSAARLAGPAELLGEAVTVTVTPWGTAGAGRVAPWSGSGPPVSVAVTGATGAAITCSGGAGVTGATFREGSPPDAA